MYRGLLGDCFLLTHEHDGRTFRALIDCGVLQCIGNSKPETKKGAERLGRAVTDLIKDCGGRLDLVIVTHAHYDHLAGFILFNAQFAAVSIGAVWVGWTENPHDDLAQAIREHRSRGLTALAALAASEVAGGGAAMADPVNAERMQTVTDLLQFYGEIEASPSSPFAVESDGKKPSASARPRSCDAAIAWLRGQAGEPQVSYLEPGQQVRLGVGGLLVANVLGPPRGEKRLTKMDPTAGAAREVYLASKDEVLALELTLRLVAGDASGPKIPERAIPFTQRFRRWEGEGSADPLAKRYYDPSNQDRRIDGEWIGTAEALALKIDGDVNNTSLALAIELPGGDVLLFPGDAQVGNWLSWHDQSYPSKPAITQKSRTAAELLARVVLYKAGHHLSHNATARAMGLELMTSPDLVAMGPLVETVAREQVTKSNPHGWAMPYSDLMVRLRAKTQGRIVRGDGKPADEIAAFDGSRFTVGYADKTSDPLWVSLTLIHSQP